MKYLIFIISFCFSISLLSQETTMEFDTLKAESKYYGKSLFIKNPFISVEKGGQFTCQQVIVNGEVLDTDINATVFEIKLAERKKGDELIIEIVYIKGSKPVILNLTN